jgi:hypothetical protein
MDLAVPAILMSKDRTILDERQANKSVSGEKSPEGLDRAQPRLCWRAISSKFASKDRQNFTLRFAQDDVWLKLQRGKLLN